MQVPFLRLFPEESSLRREIETSVRKVIRRGTYILGPETEAFEHEWANYCGAKYCVGVGSGLDALQLGLLAKGVMPGDEVLVPQSTFVATWFAVSNIGATPLAVPVDSSTFNLDPSRILEQVSKRLKSIIPVHLFGRPAPMNEIRAIAAELNLEVIEDAAQAHGALYFGEPLGVKSNLAAWSFYPGKNLGAMGDAGGITTNSREVYETLKLLRNYGSSAKYRHDVIGFNSRLDEIQAAVLRAKLQYLDSWVARRTEIATLYNSLLAPLLEQDLGLKSIPPIDNNLKSSWHLYVISVENRDSVRAFMLERGVETGIHYPLDPAFQRAYSDRDHSQERWQTNRGSLILSLPIGPFMLDEEVEYSAAALKQALLYSNQSISH